MVGLFNEVWQQGAHARHCSFNHCDGYIESKRSSMEEDSTSRQGEEWETVCRYVVDEVKAEVNAQLVYADTCSRSRCTKGKCMSSALKHPKVRGVSSVGFADQGRHET